MYPKVCSIGPFTLHSYGLLIALGVFVSVFLMNRMAKSTGFPTSQQIFDLVFVVILSGFLGARIFYVVQEWPWYREHPLEIIQIWQGGLVYYGGVTASFLAFFAYVRFIRLPFLASMDFVLPFVALTHAFGRVGCFLNGCCFGRDHYPVQLFEALFNGLLFAFLITRYRGRRFPGEVTSLYFILYPMGRFFLEYLRGDQMPWFHSLTLHQVLSVAFILPGMVLYAICRKRG